MSLLKCVLKMTTRLDVECDTYFLDDNMRPVDASSSLRVSDLPPLCQEVRLLNRGRVEREFCFETKRFVFI